jgi:hypothetical protein
MVSSMDVSPIYQTISAKKVGVTDHQDLRQSSQAIKQRDAAMSGLIFSACICQMNDQCFVII